MDTYYISILIGFVGPVFILAGFLLILKSSLNRHQKFGVGRYVLVSWQHRRWYGGGIDSTYNLLYPFLCSSSILGNRSQKE